MLAVLQLLEQEEEDEEREEEPDSVSPDFSSHEA